VTVSPLTVVGEAATDDGADAFGDDGEDGDDAVGIDVLDAAGPPHALTRIAIATIRHGPRRLPVIATAYPEITPRGPGA
jgi:hypothetical protein